MIVIVNSFLLIIQNQLYVFLILSLTLQSVVLEQN